MDLRTARAYKLTGMTAGTEGPPLPEGPPLEERALLRSSERLLTSCLVLLKLNRLYMAWGRMEGFDAGPWIDVFHATHWFRRLPDPKSLFGAYHPPLSYLVARLLYAAYPHEVEVSQLLSTLALVGVTFALRDALRTLGVLWTLPGLAMLYVTTSLPLLVWLAIETSYDALVFMWFTVALALSLRLFWAPAPATPWKSPRHLALLGALGLTLAAGLFTKFNALFALPLPFLIILVRRGARALLRELGPPLASAGLAVALVSPLYYFRYYAPLHAVFPSNMDWLKEKDLKGALARRDADRWGFWVHVLRVPSKSISSTTEPVRDSFLHSTWFQLWKRDEPALGGKEGALALAVSNLYARTFPIVVAVSSALLCFQRRRLPAVWRHLGAVLFVVFVTYASALLYYGWRYPLWDWTPLKAKYMTPVVLWIGYCAALPVVRRSASPLSPRVRRVAVTGALFGLLVFMFVNHLLPVY